MQDYFVIIDKTFLKSITNFADFSKINLEGVVIDGGENVDVHCGDRKIPSYNFTNLRSLVNANKNFNDVRYFLIGHQKNLSDTKNIRDIMVSYGADKNSIYNFSLLVFSRHIAQLKYAIEKPIDFFATGISYAEAGLDLKEFKNLIGVNLAFSGQDLWSGYEMAKLVFAKQKVKFVLIELPVYTFSYDMSLSFSARWQAWHYRAFLPDFDEDFPDKHLIEIVNEKYFDIYRNTPIATDEERLSIRHPWHNKVISSMSDYFSYKYSLDQLEKVAYPKTAKKNKRILGEYIDLCKENGAKPILFTLPHATLLQDNFNEKSYKDFMNNIKEVLKKHDAKYINLFYERLDDKCFFDLQHLNFMGAKIISAKIYEDILGLV